MVVSVTNDLKVVSTVREGCCESLILSALLDLLLDELKEENGMDGRGRERERYGGFDAVVENETTT